MTAPAAAPAVDVRRAADRPRTQIAWLDSSHSFSFGRHYDPRNTSHGVLLVNNDDVVRAGAGFETHPHRDMEIVTWVVQGSLVHQDSTGHSGVIHPGLAQRMSAGSGILHSEKNDAYRADGAYADVPVHFVQMWVAPAGSDRTPGYEQLEIGDARLRSGLVPVASGLGRHAGDTAITIGNAGAALHAARLSPGQVVDVPDAPWVHLFVAAGSVSLEGAGPLVAGDAVRLTGAGGRRLEALDPAEVLVWEMHVTLG
ncbi:MAG: putative PIRIN-like protein [Frankiales bacterium]|nr:putative PIRIN-like protein [Frankiales bacterium]